MDDLVKQAKRYAAKLDDFHDAEMIRTLLLRVEELLAENTKLLAFQNPELLQRAEKAEAQNKRLREALQFYATAWDGHLGDSGPGGNDPQEPDWWPDEALIEDGGRKAKAALEDSDD